MRGGGHYSIILTAMILQKRKKLLSLQKNISWSDRRIIQNSTPPPLANPIKIKSLTMLIKTTIPM